MRKEALLWRCAVLLLLGTLSRAGEPRPHLGVILDDAPLPELLTKHLQLDPGQGLRISNIILGGPADKAGLERDDLIVAFQGAKVMSYPQFVAAVRGAGVGAEVTLDVVHLGQRKTIHVKLEAAPEPKKAVWKYPPEPETMMPWRLGRIFKIGPDGRELLEVPFDRIPDLGRDFRRFMKESYTYHRTTEGEDCTITIEGDPADQDSELVVQAGEQKYSATVGSIKALPEKYREPARQAVEDARSSVAKDGHARRFSWPGSWGPEARRQFFEGLPRPDLQRLLEQKDLALKKLQEQMEQLRQRVNEMDTQNREMLDRLRQKSETKKSKSAEPPPSAPAEAPSKPVI